MHATGNERNDAANKPSAAKKSSQQYNIVRLRTKFAPKEPIR